MYVAFTPDSVHKAACVSALCALYTRKPVEKIKKYFRKKKELSVDIYKAIKTIKEWMSRRKAEGRKM